MRMTVADIISLIDWGRILAICPRLPDGSVDPRVYLALNRSQARMLSRGDWVGSTQIIKLCLDQGCITLPRQVERIDAASINGMNLDVRNPWYSFMPRINDYCSGGSYWGYGPFGITGGNLLDKGFHTTFRDLIPGSKKIRIYCDSPNDVGKEVLIQAIDPSNQQIIESPNYAGFKMVLALPYVESSYYLGASPLGIIKPVTERNINLYEVDTANSNSLRLLGIYEPSETTIELRRYQIPGYCCTTTCQQVFLALVKLKHISVSRESDYLVIENPSAFEEFIRMLEAKDAGNIEKAITAEADGVRELNLQKRNSSPGDQISISVRTQGKASPWKHGVGRM